MDSPNIYSVFVNLIWASVTCYAVSFTFDFCVTTRDKLTHLAEKRLTLKSEEDSWATSAVSRLLGFAENYLSYLKSQHQSRYQSNVYDEQSNEESSEEQQSSEEQSNADDEESAENFYSILNNLFGKKAPESKTDDDNMPELVESECGPSCKPHNQSKSRSDIETQPELKSVPKGQTSAVTTGNITSPRRGPTTVYASGTNDCLCKSTESLHRRLGLSSDTKPSVPSKEDVEAAIARVETECKTDDNMPELEPCYSGDTYAGQTSIMTTGNITLSRWEPTAVEVNSGLYTDTESLVPTTSNECEIDDDMPPLTNNQEATITNSEETQTNSKETEVEPEAKVESPIN